jgi:nucleotide-binding universal stress UspA family protein
MAKKILVGYDGTESAHRALERGASLHVDGDLMTIIAVAAITPGGGHGAVHARVEDAPPDQRAALDVARAWLAERGIVAETIAAVGDPGTAICEVAERDGFDTIIVGSRNLRGMKRLLLGSVSDRVAHHAPCDVLIAK